MRPNFLKNNSKIICIAPSFGCTTSPYKQRLNRAIKNLKKEKFIITIGENVYKNDGIAASNTPMMRAKEFMDAYQSDNDAILSVGGGETMNEILEYIDFDKISQLPPKWFIGFSDNTNLTYTLTTLCNLETIYGNNAPNFYMTPFVYDTLDTLNLLRGAQSVIGYPGFQLKETKNIYPKYEFDHKKEIIAYQYEKPFSGILLGGCLDCLQSLCGTKYDNTKVYSENKSIIFYLEACDLTSIGIRRALFQLKNANWFTNVVGFLIGRSRLYEDTSFGLTPIDSYIDMLKEYQVPILLDVDLGHISPSMPIRNGALATITYENDNILIQYKD